MALGFCSRAAETGEETDAVVTVVAGVTMVTVDGGPEVSTVGATVVEDERIGTAVQDVDKGECDTVDTDDDSVVLAAVTVCETLVTLQFVTNGAPPAV